MGQMGFFDIAKRYAGLDAKNDPLLKIDEVVPWEDFRPRLEAPFVKLRMAQAGQGTEVVGGAQTLGCGGDVQGDRSLRAL